MNKKSVVAALSALAFETRLDVVQLLTAIGDEGLPAGELARQLGVQQNTMSDHLAALARAGIITAERRSRSIIYRTNPAVMRDLVGFLASQCGANAAA